MRMRKRATGFERNPVVLGWIQLQTPLKQYVLGSAPGKDLPQKCRQGDLSAMPDQKLADF
jgi:hypothetical protein